MLAIGDFTFYLTTGTDWLLMLAAGNAGVKRLLNDTQPASGTAAASRRSSYVDVDNELSVTTIERRQRLLSHTRYSNSATLHRCTS